MHVAMRSTTLSLTLAAALLGCSSSPTTPTPGDAATRTDAASDAPGDAATSALNPRMECNPLGLADTCVFPFPSAFYEREDTAAMSGVRLALVPESLPTSRGQFTMLPDDPIDVAPYNRIDGFSPSTPLLAAFAERIDPATLIAPDRMDQSVSAMGSTAIVDMETHERIAHFSEVDVNVRDGERQLVILRPAVRLRPGRRYAVAITRAVRAVGGAVPTVPAGFRAILDGRTASDPRLARLAPRYDAIFTQLQMAGIQRDNLLLAWDFVTASEQYLTQPVRQMRDTALSMVGADGMSVTIGMVEENFNTNILRRVRGTFRVPLFLTGERPGATMQRGMDGAPSTTRMYDVPFVAMIPRSAMTRGPLPLILFGHGLLGSGVGELGEARDTTNYMQRFLNDRGFVAVATNWIGLSSEDQEAAVIALSNINRFPSIADRLQQSLVNAMVLYRTARGQFGGQTAFQVNGMPAFDRTKAYYYGISLGGIMGTSFMGYSTECDRGVLNVAGGNWALLLQRSSNFSAYSIGLADYPDPADRQVLFVLLQSLFDPSDGVNVAPHMLADRLPMVPEKHVLFQMAVGDAQVSNLASEMVVRSMRLPMLTPTPRHTFGIPEMTGPLDAAFTVWDEHPMPAPDLTNRPAMNNNTHGSIRDLMALKEQIGRFLTPTGRVEHTCDGPCDPQ